MGAVAPLTRGPPLELRGVGSVRQRRSRAEQRLDIDTIVHRSGCGSHSICSSLGTAPNRRAIDSEMLGLTARSDRNEPALPNLILAATPEQSPVVIAGAG